MSSSPGTTASFETPSLCHFSVGFPATLKVWYSPLCSFEMLPSFTAHTMPPVAATKNKTASTDHLYTVQKDSSLLGTFRA